MYAQDETDLLLFPPLRSSWSLRGQPKRVWLSGRNDRRVIFGSLNLLTGRRILLPREHQRADDFCEYLRWMRWQEPDGLIALLLDEDSCHTAHASQRLAERLDIWLLWLPVRCPHLNPMEPLWGRGKQVVCANQQEPRIDIRARQFIDYLSGLSDEEALQTAGVHAPRFWLRTTLLILILTCLALQRAFPSETPELVPIGKPRCSANEICHRPIFSVETAHLNGGDVREISNHGNPG